MKFKTMLLISIMLITLTVSAVSAQDNLTLTADESLEASSEIPELSQTPKTFNDIQTMINSADENDTIELDGYYEGSGTPIKIKKALTINGNNAVLDAKSQSKILDIKVDDTSKVFLKDISFVNAKASNNGGAANGGSLYNCSFKNCVASKGGAVAGGYLNHCTITDCHADNGGALYNSEATDCKFKNCYSVKYGGAIKDGWASHSTFINCNSGEDGGAISEGHAQYCSFKNCKAGNSFKNDHGHDGGAINNGWATNCQFENCRADKFGGAIQNGNAINCTFKNCTCGDTKLKVVDAQTSYLGTGDGGGIHNGSATNCKFVDCYTENYGGAIDSGNAYNSTFKNCGCRKDGGAISKGSAFDSKFTDCYTISDGGSVDRGDATNCEFKNSRAIKYGGALNMGTARNCIFINCKSTESCGGSVRGSAIDCTFTNSFAEKDGGAVYDGSVTNCTFTNCKANRCGGALYYGNAKNCVFTNNVAMFGGAMSGGLYGTPTEKTNVHKCTATKCQFTKNTAKTSGGALCGASQVSSTFKKNSAPKDNNINHFLTLSSVKVKKSASKLVLTAKLIRAYSDKKVTFKFNGVKYTAQSKDGIAKVTVKKSVLKKLKAGKKVTYQATFMGDTVKKSVKVKK